MTFFGLLFLFRFPRYLRLILILGWSPIRLSCLLYAFFACLFSPSSIYSLSMLPLVDSRQGPLPEPLMSPSLRLTFHENKFRSPPTLEASSEPRGLIFVRFFVVLTFPGISRPRVNLRAVDVFNQRQQHSQQIACTGSHFYLDCSGPAQLSPGLVKELTTFFLSSSTESRLSKSKTIHNPQLSSLQAVPGSQPPPRSVHIHDAEKFHIPTRLPPHADFRPTL